ncbi:MAG TPA: carbohydrate binding domain-containing protein, partial [Acidimicrobiales bacterium]|nr:carbohydrate binding domain-containing protein [Acidimicrobiales bacterium]
STAFNLDVSLMYHRLCYQGYVQWLTSIGYTSYKAGDLWGCVGQWYSGNWYDAGAKSYITTVQSYLASKPWTQASFSNVSTVNTSSPLKYDFEGGSTDGWGVGWGSLSVATTTSPVHSGSGALAIKLNPTGADWPAVQVSSPPGLAAGTKVTYWVYQPAGAVISSVQAYVADGIWNDVYTPAVKLVTGWNNVTWTVPTTNGINGIGLEINNDAGWKGQLTLDSVSW